MSRQVIDRRPVKMQAVAVKYFFGRISRDEAEDALRAAGIREGLFLLRESIEQAGDYVLSICHDGRCATLRNRNDYKGGHAFPSKRSPPLAPKRNFC